MSVDWYKVKRSIGITTYLLVIALANVMFWSGWHNLDLLQNYSLLISDFNSVQNCDVDFYDVREIQDCNLVGCGEFKDIYMRSKTMEIIAYFLTMALVGDGLVKRYKELDDKTRD